MTHPHLEGLIPFELIDRCAQRLVSWQDGSVWPDSWAPDQVRQARRDAEKVLLEAFATAPRATDGEWVPVKPEGAPYWGIHTADGRTIAGTASGLSEGDAKLICALYERSITPRVTGGREVDDLARKWDRVADELELIAPTRSERFVAELLRKCAYELRALQGVNGGTSND